MSLSSKIKKLFRISSEGKKMLFEAFWTSLKYEYHLKRNNYNPVKHLHKDNEGVKLTGDIHPETLKQLQSTANVIKLLQKYAPWKPMCYNRAMTAKEMLNARNIKTKMHIGFRKKDNEFDGHAWLTYNDILVTGKIKGLHKFKQLQSLKTG